MTKQQLIKYDKGLPSLGSGGGVLRDSSGMMLMTFHSFFGPCSSLLAEARAMLLGIALAISRGYSGFLVETDSKLLFQMVTGQIRTHWNLAPIIRKIHQLAPLIKAFGHVFREANGVADVLANIGFADKELRVFSAVETLPFSVRKALRVDELAIGSFRVSKK